MKHILAAFLFCSISTIANANDESFFQTNKPVLCGDTATVFKSLDKNFQEYPAWVGKDGANESRYSLFVNKKTGSWTLIQFTKDLACVIGLGDESRDIPEKPSV
jgi:hypothetical protein